VGFSNVAARLSSDVSIRLGSRVNTATPHSSGRIFDKDCRRTSDTSRGDERPKCGHFRSHRHTSSSVVSYDNQLVVIHAVAAVGDNAAIETVCGKTINSEIEVEHPFAKVLFTCERSGKDKALLQ
jgi:hypothetical protein